MSLIETTAMLHLPKSSLHYKKSSSQRPDMAAYATQRRGASLQFSMRFGSRKSGLPFERGYTVKILNLPLFLFFLA